MKIRDPGRLAAYLKRHRDERDIDQVELARRAETHPSTISRLEQRRTRRLQDTVAKSLAAALGISPAELRAIASPPVDPTTVPDTDDDRIYRPIGGDALAVVDAVARAEGLAESERQLVLAHVRFILERIEETRAWERGRRLAVKADEITRTPRAELDGDRSEPNPVGA